MTGGRHERVKEKINYTVVCVNEFANRFHIAAKDAFTYLYDHEGIAFIKDHYDIEHTLSLDEAIEDLAIICRNKRTGESNSAVKEGWYRIMNKEQQMVEYMVQDLVEMIVETEAIEYDQAMHLLYGSNIFEKISDIETGLYRESPAYVYGLFQDEINFGHIVQAEV